MLNKQIDINPRKIVELFKRIPDSVRYIFFIILGPIVSVFYYFGFAFLYALGEGKFHFETVVALVLFLLSIGSFIGVIFKQEVAFYLLLALALLLVFPIGIGIIGSIESNAHSFWHYL